MEGKATIISDDDDGIEVEGDLTIQGSDDGNPQLEIFVEDDAINCDGEVDILNCKIKISAGYWGVYADTMNVDNSELVIFSDEDGLCSDGELLIEDSVIAILSYYDSAINSDDNMTFTASELNISSLDSVGIYSGDGKISFVDCDVRVESTDDIAISAPDNDISVSGGRLVIVSKEEALKGNKITLSDNVFMDLSTLNANYNLFEMYDTSDFSLPGTICLYDIDGNKLYEGEWSSEFLDGTELYVDGQEVFRVVSVCIHEWDTDVWEKDENYHWHPCKNPYCDENNHENCDGYGEHNPQLINALAATETIDGYTGDTVCKDCGYLISSGTVISATGTNPGPGNPNSPNAGDYRNLGLWIGLLLVGGCTACGVVIYRKRNNKIMSE